MIIFYPLDKFERSSSNWIFKEIGSVFFTSSGTYHRSGEHSQAGHNSSVGLAENDFRCIIIDFNYILNVGKHPLPIGPFTIFKERVILIKLSLERINNCISVEVGTIMEFYSFPKMKCKSQPIGRNFPGFS